MIDRNKLTPEREHTWKEMQEGIIKMTEEAINAYKTEKDIISAENEPDLSQSEWLAADDPYICVDMSKAMEEGWEGIDIVLLKNKTGSFITAMAFLDDGKWHVLGNSSEADTVEALRTKLGLRSS